MLVDLLVVVGLGGVAAAAVLLVYRTLGRRAPRALILVAAGLGMIVYATWSRYTWAARTIATLPPQVVVVQERTDSNPLEPWVRWFPRADGLVTLDRADLRRHPDHPGLVWARLTLIGRDEARTLVLDRLVECQSRRWMALPPDRPLGADGLPEGGTWIDGRDDPHRALIAAACTPADGGTAGEDPNGDGGGDGVTAGDPGSSGS